MGLLDRVFGSNISKKNLDGNKQVNYVYTKVSALKKLHELIHKNFVVANESAIKLAHNRQLSKFELEQIQWMYISNNPYTPWESLHDSIRDILSKEGISEENYNFYNHLRDLDMANVIDDIVGSFNVHGSTTDDRIVEGLVIIMALVEYERTGSLRDEWPLDLKEFALANFRIFQTANINNLPFNYDIIALGDEWNKYRCGLRWNHDIHKYFEEKMDKLGFQRNL